MHDQLTEIDSDVTLQELNDENPYTSKNSDLFYSVPSSASPSPARNIAAPAQSRDKAMRSAIVLAARKAAPGESWIGLSRTRYILGETTYILARRQSDVEVDSEQERDEDSPLPPLSAVIDGCVRKSTMFQDPRHLKGTAMKVTPSSSSRRYWKGVAKGWRNAKELMHELNKGASSRSDGLALRVDEERRVRFHQ